MVDISYFLHSSVSPDVASHNHSSLLQYYHRAHTEAIKSFGMHGYEMEMEDLLTEYHAIQVLFIPSLITIGNTFALSKLHWRAKQKIIKQCSTSTTQLYYLDFCIWKKIRPHS